MTIYEFLLIIQKDGKFTCASAAAALARLLEAGTIRPDETTVLVLTGSGLKATQRIGELLGVLP